MMTTKGSTLSHRLFFALTVILVLSLTSFVQVKKAQAQDFAGGTGTATSTTIASGGVAYVGASGGTGTDSW